MAALTRLTLREVRMHPWRSALVVAMVLVPVMVFTAAAVALRTVPDTAQETIAQNMGSADAVAMGDPVRTRRRAEALGWRAVEVHSGVAVARTGDAAPRAVRVLRTDASDPLTVGLWRPRQGRAPRGDDEVAVSRWLADAMHVGVGDHLTVGADGRSYLVTAVVGVPHDHLTVIGSGVRDGLRGGWSSMLLDMRGARSVPQGFPNVALRADLMRAAGPTRAQTAELFLLGGLGLMAFGLVVASALAVGARRQLRALGVLGATGATPGQRAAVMLLHSAVLTVAGVLVGLPAGLLGWRVTGPVLERTWHTDFGATVVRGGDLMVIAVLAVAVGLAAGMLPARVAARTGVLQALSGRRPAPALGAGVPVAGVLVSAAGCVVLAVSTSPSMAGSTARSVVATVGAAIAVAGMVIVTPYVVGRLDGLAGRLRGTGRLAARGIARHRARTGPVVAAVMATGALTVAVASLWAGIERRDRSWTTPDVVELQVSGAATGDEASCAWSRRFAERVRAVLPGTREACAVQAQVGDRGVVLVHQADLDTLGLQAVRGDLAAGRAVDAGSGAPTSALRVRTPRGVARVPVVPMANVDVQVLRGMLVMDAAAAARLGVDVRTATVTVVFRTPRPLDDRQRASLAELSDSDLGVLVADPGRVAFASLTFDRSGTTPYATMVRVVLPLAGLLAVLVVLVGLAQVSADGRDERATLVAVGASPGQRRRMGAVQAGLLTLIGQVLAVPVGLACAAIVQRANDEVTAVPWTQLAVLLVVVPLVSTAVAWAVVRPGAPAPRRRAV